MLQREPLRNLGIIAHVDAGKTTLSEQLLLLGGVIPQAGRVDEGLSTMDYLPEEQKRGITIRAGLASFRWKGARINFIDTPGHIDFGLEVERSLRVLDGAIAVFCGVRGVESRSRAVWALADRFSVPRLIWINKLDMPGADYAGTLLEIEEAFGVTVLPVNWPIVRKQTLVGCVDLLSGQAWGFQDGRRVAIGLPPDWAAESEPNRQRLLEEASRAEDELMECLLAEQVPSANLVRKAVRKACLQGLFVPASGGSALQGLNVESLLDLSIGCLPEPSTPEMLRGSKGIGLIYKVTRDPGEPPVALVRLYAGRIEPGDTVYRVGTDEQCQVGDIAKVFADRLDPSAALEAGDISAVMLEGEWRPGDTIAVDSDAPVLEANSSQRLVLQLALETENRDDHARLGDVLKSLALEDGALEYEQEMGTGRWIVHGQGEVQLDVLVSRIHEEYGCPVHVGAPRVKRRERMLQGGNWPCEKTIWEDQWLELAVAVSPSENGIEILWQQGRPENGQLMAMEAGIREAAANGRWGAGILGSKWEISANWSDSRRFPPGLAKRMVDHVCGKLLGIAMLVIEVPSAKIEIGTPEECVGMLLGDLKSRAATIQAVDTQRNGVTIRAIAPLERMLGYATLVRSLSKGQATLSLEPHDWVVESAETETPL